MGSDVRERGSRSHRAAFDLVITKLQRPLLRPGIVQRTSLMDMLRQNDSRPVVSVVAPAGYGKTTLLSQWADRSGQAFAWVSVEEPDNDPKVLLAYVAQALNDIEPLDQRIFDALASPVSSVPGSVVPRLISAFWSMTSPVALILDDVHVLHNRECRDALSVLADHVPGGSRLVMAGRGPPPLRVARLRVEGKILEIGPANLSFTRGEASSLLHNADVAVGQDELEELYRRTEGWPAGLYLAALVLRQGGAIANAVHAFGGGDVFVSEYLESEFLSRVSQEHRMFLTRTAVLERVSGPLCDAVLDLRDTHAILADIARSNLLLVPLDRRGEWYRYHHLFRDMLLGELHRQSPELIPVLRGRAADWCLRNSLPEQALEYFMAAGDVDSAAALVEKLTVPTHRKGRVSTIQRWFRWLEERGGLNGRPMATMLISLLSALTGRPVEAERWADVLDHWQHGDGNRFDPAVERWVVLLRAILCRHGVDQMRADADDAVQRFAAGNFITPGPVLVQGISHVLLGDLDDGDACLEDAVKVAESVDASDDLAAALIERSLVAMAREQWDQAEALAQQASSVLDKAGIEQSYATPLVCAVRARVALYRGDIPAAHQHLVRAQRLRPVLTYAVPHLAVQARIELARAHLALPDIAGARTLMREVDELLRYRPGLGNLVDEARAVRARLGRERGSALPGASSLTSAELRLLPMLSTHLSFPEIAGEMFLSRHTVKAEANSIYRKLGVSSRSQAVSRSRELGLLDK